MLLAVAVSVVVITVPGASASVAAESFAESFAKRPPLARVARRRRTNSAMSSVSVASL